MLFDETLLYFHPEPIFFDFTHNSKMLIHLTAMLFYINLDKHLTHPQILGGGRWGGDVTDREMKNYTK